VSERQKLEDERTKLKLEIDSFQFPCPDCGRHVGRIPWNKEHGGECPHCLAKIEPADFAGLLGEIKAKWDRIFELATLITQASMKEHVVKLRTSLASWQTFLERGCRTEDFTRGVYHLLSSTFYNIAHTDRNGFYQAQFGTLTLTVETFGRMKKFVSSSERSDKESPMAKLENEIVDVLDETEILPKLEKRLADETRRDELAELKRLREKYCVPQ
jgi:predicted RNA-binding Zn-ribbon protein involved in translation (DUF1610 family)